MVRDMNSSKVTFRWLVGVLIALMLPIAGIAISTWADTNKNTEELAERKESVDAVPLLKQEVQHIKTQVDENGDQIAVTQKTVNKIAIKLGVEPE